MIAAGAILNWLFYDRLLDGLRPELDRVNPTNEQGRRAQKHHQHLSEETGRPVLVKMILIVTALARAARTWASFKESVEITLPRAGGRARLQRAPRVEQLWFPWFSTETGEPEIEGAD